jgi:hypothetical protein
MKYHRFTPSIPAMLAGMLFCVGVVVVNEATGTDEVVGEKYTASFTYCDAYQYNGKGGSTCIHMKGGTEQRVDRIHHGMLWDQKGYLVVR